MVKSLGVGGSDSTPETTIRWTLQSRWRGKKEEGGLKDLEKPGQHLEATGFNVRKRLNTRTAVKTWMPELFQR